MKITQEMVDRIVDRAAASSYGIGEPLHEKAGVLKIANYETKDLEALALCLVNAYHEKYDLVSIFFAALEVVEEESASAIETRYQTLKRMGEK